MSHKKEKQPPPMIYGYFQDNGINLERVYLINQLKAEIKRVNQVLRETHNPKEFKQNKKYLERLERRLRNAERN